MGEEIKMNLSRLSKSSFYCIFTITIHRIVNLMVKAKMSATILVTTVSSD